MLTSQLWTQVIKSVSSLHSHYLSALKSFKQAHGSPKSKSKSFENWHWNSTPSSSELAPASEALGLAMVTRRPTWALGHLVSHLGIQFHPPACWQQLQDTHNSVATYVRNWLPSPVARRLHTRQGLATRG